MLRQGLRRLLEEQPFIQVCGESGARDQAIELARQTQPNIILLELNLDGDLDIEIIPALLIAAPKTRVILVTGIVDASLRRQAVQMGVMGVVLKEHPISVLIRAIEKVHAGEVWIDRAMMANVLTNLSRLRMGEPEDPEAARISSLTDRERQVIRLIGAGLKNKDVAGRLSISEVTVRHHLTSVYSKLGVADRLELTIYAYRNGLAELPT